MPLRLSRIDHPDPLYSVISGEVKIGVIQYSRAGPAGPRWRWLINVISPGMGLEPHEGSGSEHSLEAAKEKLAGAWRTWLARAGLREAQEPA